MVGLTVVAFGTSAPELSISLLSLLKGQADLSVGNVVGSNIANILLILGSSALLAPLVVSGSSSASMCPSWLLFHSSFSS